MHKAHLKLHVGLEYSQNRLNSRPPCLMSSSPDMLCPLENNIQKLHLLTELYHFFLVY